MDEGLERQDRIVRLGDIMGSLADPDRKAAVLDIARKTRAPVDLVEGQFDFWKGLAEQSSSPADFYERNPELAAIALDQPFVGEILVKDKALTTLQKALGGFRSFVGLDQLDAAETEQFGAPQFTGPNASFLRAIDPARHVPGEVPGVSPGVGQQAVEAGPIGKLEGSERLTGHWEKVSSDTEYVDPMTGEVTPAGSPVYRQTVPGIYQYRLARSLGNTDSGSLALRYAATVMAGGDGYELRKRAVDARRRPEQDLQANPLEELFLGVSDLAGSQAMSTSAMVLGGSVAGPPGAAAASFGTSFVQEMGNTWDFVEQRDDQGRPIDPHVAVGAGIAYSLVAAAIETGVNMGPWAKLLGGTGGAVTKADVKAFLVGLAKDPAKQAILAKVAKQWVKTAAAEGLGEETSQGILADLAGWYARSRSAGLAEGGTFSAQEADPVGSLGENIDTGLSVTASTLVAGAAPAGLTYRNARQETQRSQTSAQQLAAITKAIPDSPTAKGAPEAFAAAVAAETAASGEVVTAAHIDPAGINRLAQEGNVDPVELVREVAGEAGVAAYQEALATGTKMEVPMAEYVERWHQAGLAEALLPDTATRATGVMTPRERVANAEEIAAEVTRLVEEIGSKEDKPTPSEALFTQMAKELAAAGKLKKAQVEPQVKLWRKFVRTEAAKNGLDVEAVAKDLALKIAKAQSDVAPVQALLSSRGVVFHGSQTKGLKSLETAPVAANGRALGPGLYVSKSPTEAAAYGGSGGAIYEIPFSGTMLDLGTLLSEQGAAGEAALRALSGIGGGESLIPPGQMNGTDLYRELTAKLGQDGASAALAAEGLDGIESGTKLVIFNPAALTIATEHADFASAASSTLMAGEGSSTGVRGWLDTVKAGGKRLQSIFLTDKADLSTFLHESAHAFWELKADLADAPLKPQQATDAQAVAQKIKAQEDMRAALDFMGVKDRSELDARAAEATAIRALAQTEKRGLTAEEKALVKALVEPFEKWARGFEAYLREGKAPSLSLAGAFRTFRLWLTQVYRSLKSLNVDLDPTIRGVFDRMLATEDEIAAAAKAIGIDGPALEDAKSRAEVAALKEVQQSTEHWWKTEMVKALAEADDAYDRLPEVVNNDLLRRGREAGVEGLPTKQPVPPRKAWVQKEADAIMAARHPGILEERARLKALVEKALHEEPSVVEELHNQWTQDREKSGKKGAPIEAIRAAAQIIIGRQLTQQLSPRKYFNAERAAFRQRAKAEAKGDWTAAALASQQRLLSFYLYRESLRAKEQVDGIQELAGKMVSPKGIERLGKASPVYRDVALRVMEAAGLVEGIPAESQQHGMVDLVGALQTQDMEPDFDMDVVGALLSKPKAFDDLTVSEMGEVDNALKQIRRAARNRLTVVVNGQRVALDAVVGDIKSEASRLPKKKAPPESSSRPNQDEVTITLSGALDYITDPLTTFLDDDYLGPTARQAFRDRYYKQRGIEHELMKLVAVKTMEAIDGMSPEMQASLYDDVDRSMLPRFPGQRREGKVGRDWMLLLLANLGNQGNMDRLLGGRDWTMEQVAAFFQANKLTAEEARFVQSLWTLNDRHLWPRIAAVHEAVNGTKPPKVEARPLALKLADGQEITLQGGYWPAMADPKESELGQKQEDVTTASAQNYDTMRASLLKGFTRGRADNARYVVRLDDFGAYPAHVMSVIRYIAYEEFVRDAGRILKALKPTVEDRLGGSAYAQLDRWLKVVASGSPDSISSVEKDLVRILGFVVGRTVRTAMMTNLKNAMADLGNPLLSIVGPKGARVRPDFLLGSVLEASVGLMAPASTGRGFAAMRAETLAKSPELQIRHDESSRKVREQFDRFGAGGRRWRPLAKVGSTVEPGRILDWIHHYGFIFQHMAEVWGTTIAWQAAYRQAKSKGVDETEAIRRADDIIQKNWNSSLNAEKSALLRSKAAGGALTMMQGFFNRMATKSRQTLHPAMVEFGNAEGWWDKSKVGAKHAAWATGPMLMGIWFVTNVVGSLLEGRGPEDGEDEVDWLRRKMIAAPFTQIPLVNEAVPFLEAALASDEVKGKLKYSASERASPAVSSAIRVLKSLGTIGDEEKEDSKRYWAAYEAAAFALGLPVSQVKRSGQYIFDLAEDPGESLDLWKLVYGNNPMAPANPGDFMEDAP
ncbi:MAG: hypothetical protein IPO00_08815 [Betaproteobacteria bacterium]|nr:hypothetical protein [Betaproteobacteria bacterium]